MRTSQYIAQIMQELGQMEESLSDDVADTLIDRMLKANNIFVAGAGRSGLMGRAFAMRLMHLGLQAYVVGESVTPNVARGDILVIGSGSGTTKTLAVMADKAKTLAADVALVTIMPDSMIGQLASIVITLPGSPKETEDNERTSQPMGSLFEQSLLLFYDAIILRMMDRQAISSAMMFERHANLE